MSRISDALIAHYKMNENAASDNELVTNGDFAANITGWSQYGLETFEWDAGELHIVETGTTYSYANQDIGLVVGRKYAYSFDVTKNSGEVLDFRAGNTQTIVNNMADSGSHSGTFVCTDAEDIRFVIGAAAADWNIDNVSVKLYAAEDSSGNDHDGLLAEDTDAAHVAGKINGAFDFAGGAAPTDYMEIADHADFSPGDGSTGTPFSISAWIYMHDATNFYIASKGIYNEDGEWGFAVNADSPVH